MFQKQYALSLTVGAILILSGCFLTPTPTPEGPGTNPDGTSRLDEAGLAHIEQTHQVYFDISNRQLLRSDLGLKPNEHVPDIHFGPPLTLTIKGPNKTITTQTDYIRFLAYHGKPDIKRITYFLTAQTPEELTTLIRQGMEEFDTTHPELIHGLNGFIDYINTSAQPFFHATTMGYAPGFVTSYDIRYEGPGRTSVIIATITPDTNEDNDQAPKPPIIDRDNDEAPSP